MFAALQQRALLGNALGDFPAQGIHLDLAVLQQGRQIGSRGGLGQAAVQRTETLAYNGLQPAGTALLGGTVDAQAAEIGQVTGDALASPAIGRQILRLVGDQIAPLAGLGVLHIRADLGQGGDDLITVAYPALGLSLIVGKLDGDIGDDRQHQKKRYREQQHQTIGGQNLPCARLPRVRTKRTADGSPHRVRLVPSGRGR